MSGVRIASTIRRLGPRAFAQLSPACLAGLEALSRDESEPEKHRRAAARCLEAYARWRERKGTDYGRA